MYKFANDLAKIINTAQSRSVILTGNVYDLFNNGEKYVPLVDFLLSQYKVEATSQKKGLTRIVYELNSPIEFRDNNNESIDELEKIWNKRKRGDDLKGLFVKAQGSPTLAMEALRQLTILYRNVKTINNLLIIIEAADMFLPQTEINRMSIADRRRVSIVHNWFSDPEFMEANDSVILISESVSTIHNKVARLPQVLSVEIPAPSLETRMDFLKSSEIHLAKSTAGLSIHAIQQLLRSGDTSPEHVISKVEDYICSQLGEGVVEFKKPEHKLKDAIGFSKLKKFCKKELIPRFLADDESALSGCAIAGPIGSGKTFFFEAVAAEMDVPVLVLKNLRSKWFGETDVIFERLHRAITALDKVLIFVDEADTQFGKIDGGHETERRLTGKIQAMMSDVKLKGKVIWLLMTARIHLLSPDIRRPGRVGDLIIPVLDPEGQDFNDFVDWVIKGIKIPAEQEEDLANINEITRGRSAAYFTSLRSRIKAEKCEMIREVLKIVEDMIPPDISETRDYQRLQALMNCTRKSLLPDSVDKDNIEEEREKWRKKILEFESQGIR